MLGVMFSLFLMSQHTHQIEYMERLSSELALVTGTPEYQEANALARSGAPREALDILGNAALAAENGEMRAAFISGMSAVLESAGATNESREAYIAAAEDLLPNLEDEARFRMLYQRSAYERDLGRTELAAEGLEELALEAGDSAPEWYYHARYMQAQNAIAAGDREEAVARLEELHKLRDNFPEELQVQTAFQLVNTSGGMNDWGRVARLGPELLKKLTENPERRMNILYHLGRAFYELRRFREAQQAYEELSGLVKQHPPQNPQILALYQSADKSARFAELQARSQEGWPMAPTPQENTEVESAAPLSQPVPPPPPLPVPDVVRQSGPPPELLKAMGGAPGSHRQKWPQAAVVPAVFFSGLLLGGLAVWAYGRSRKPRPPHGETGP